MKTNKICFTLLGDEITICFTGVRDISSYYSEMDEYEKRLEEL
jgi:hypothetical protein